MSCIMFHNWACYINTPRSYLVLLRVKSSTRRLPSVPNSVAKWIEHWPSIPGQASSIPGQAKHFGTISIPFTFQHNFYNLGKTLSQNTLP